MGIVMGARFCSLTSVFAWVVEGRGATLHPNIYNNFFVDISLL